ncbi:Acidic repeat-containing protein, partial [Pristimantis euphronides]
PICGIEGCFLHELTLPTSPYVTNFKENRDELVQRLFRLYNQTVFENKIPKDMHIFWNSDPNISAAGRCINIFQDGRRSSIIDLYETLCNSAERVVETLVHEMCHAACWIIDGVML